jgi:EAL domain-containing protein (putative c-di-GMP-specific phosphodiesterase class I)
MQNNRDSENIIDAIINMAKSLNLKTIAEGVENNHQFEMFKGKGCDEIQGYFFSRPIPSEQFLKLMQKGLE